MKTKVLQPLTWYTQENEGDLLQDYCSEAPDEAALLIPASIGSDGFVYLNLPAFQIHDITGAADLALINLNGGHITYLGEPDALQYPFASGQVATCFSPHDGKCEDASPEISRRYRLSIATDLGMMYSNVIYLQDAPDGWPCGEVLKIRWWLTGCSIDSYAHKDAEPFSMFVRSGVIAPTYESVTQEQEDGLGNKSALFKRLEKVYKFTFLGTESMADALSIAEMFDAFEVQYKNGTVLSAKTDSLDVNVDWIDGCICRISVSFRIDAALKKCCG
jgi:hypothetical protein